MNYTQEYILLILPFLMTLLRIIFIYQQEDPENNFRPSPGMITNFHAPGGHGIRVDTHAYANYMIPPYYDSMIAKLITVAQTRDEAIAKMERALEEFIIEGIKTTIPFHQKLMKNEKFRKGDYTTKFMETFEM